ncbi:MAG TPA: DUF4129 domain-containing protein, partial [Polyangiaceae bacterium]|nr:DUF4129 domain-containing protein [Polyangiaceae bacterium]
YSQLRDRPGAIGKLLSSPRSTLLGVVGLMLAAYCVVWFRRRRQALTPTARAATERETAAREVVELYRQLEAALATRGVARPSGTPPRAHALALKGLGHPTGDEALALTEMYIAGRFGGVTLNAEDRRDFMRRVRALRVQRPVERAAA